MDEKRRRIDCSGKIDYEILYYYSLYMFIQNKNKNVAYMHMCINFIEKF